MVSACCMGFYWVADATSTWMCPDPSWVCRVPCLQASGASTQVATSWELIARRQTRRPAAPWPARPLVSGVFFCTMGRFRQCCIQGTKGPYLHGSLPTATFTPVITVLISWDRCLGSPASVTLSAVSMCPPLCILAPHPMAVRSSAYTRI